MLVLFTRTCELWYWRVGSDIDIDTSFSTVFNLLLISPLDLVTEFNNTVILRIFCSLFSWLPVYTLHAFPRLPMYR